MINYDKSGLIIFDNFQIDFTLPKWKERAALANSLNPFQSAPIVMPPMPRMNRRNGNFVGSGASFIPFSHGGMVSGGGTIGSPENKEASKPSLFDRIFNRKKLKRLQEELDERMKKSNFTVELNESKEEDKMSVQDFFMSVKNSAEELDLAQERFKNYELALEHLKKTGQIALIEQMEQDLEIHRAETQLYAIGLRKVVTEKNVTDFASKSSRALRLDWIQNFTRSIPSNVVEVKLNADEKNIFDNYVVLHYDQDGKGSQKTEADVKKEKDPILFGVIAGSHKLYYVADWIDEYCDLTFDKLVETLGEDAIKANDITANIQVS